MPNANIINAADNMRKAVNDIRVHLQQTQADINNKIRELDHRIRDIDNQKNILRAQQAQALDNATTMQHQVLIRQLDKEMKETQKTRNDLHSHAQREIQELDKQAYEYENLASRLETMA